MVYPYFEHSRLASSALCFGRDGAVGHAIYFIRSTRMMIGIPIPFGPLWTGAKYVCRKIDKSIFGSAYEESHAEYLGRSGLYKHWHKLGDKFEVSLHIGDVFSNEEESEPRIAIRNNGAEHYDRVELSVTAESHGRCFQEHIVINNLGSKTHERKLIQIPRNDMWVDDADNLYTLYQKYYATLHLITVGGNTFAASAKTSVFRPSHFLLLGGHLEARWGRVWNTLYLNEAKRRFREKWLYDRCFGRGGRYTGRTWRHGWPDRDGGEMNVTLKRARTRVASPLYKLMRVERVSNFIFWSLVGVGAIDINVAKRAK